MNIVMPQPYNPNEPHRPWGDIKDPYKKDKEKWGLEPAPKPVTIETLFPNLGRWSIGFDPVFDTLKALAKEKITASYPPYNISRNGETYYIDVALAGFSKDEIDVTVVDRTLTVSTKADAKIPTDSQIKKSGTEVLYQGIAKRAFKLNFALSEHIVVKQASMEDGTLLIVCENQVPEALLPKTIDIQ
jgi:molecular chaperone IbpA